VRKRRRNQYLRKIKININIQLKSKLAIALFSFTPSLMNLAPSAPIPFATIIESKIRKRQKINKREENKVKKTKKT